LFLAIGASSGQTVTAVVNSASGLVQGLPNSGIAQGAIFLVTGSNLGPTTLATASSTFQTTNVGGTSVSVTVGSTTVNAPMYYSSSSQVAALLPSSTPTGSGTLTVNYNGNASAAVAVSVIQNNFGIFTVSQNGQGVAILTYPNYSVVSAVPGTGSLAACAPAGVCPYTYGGAANPGDTLILWGTGLGPVNGSDASGAGLSQPIAIPSSTPLTVWLGGVAANVSYSGRSGCCVGEDQIIFTVPNNVPTGCAVPLAVQIGTQVSNYAAIPVANGSRSCTMQNPAFSASGIQALTTNTSSVNYGSLSLARQIAAETSSGTIYQDIGQGEFANLSTTYLNQPTQPVVLSSLDLPPFGTCTTSNSNASAPALFTVNTGVDAGAITVTAPAPDFPVVMKEQRGTGQATTYTVNFSSLTASGVYLSGGAYTIGAAGGALAGNINAAPFTIPFTVPPTPSWPSSDQARLFANGNGVTRANGVTINWTQPASGSSPYWIEITGSGVTAAADIPTSGAGASFACWAPSSALTFNIPASILLTLPGGITGEIDFKPTLPPISFSATGLDVGILSFQYETSFFMPLK